MHAHCSITCVDRYAMQSVDLKKMFSNKDGKLVLGIEALAIFSS